MITHVERDVPHGAQLELRLHWADGQPPIVARIDQREARALIARFAFAAPDELEAAVAGARSESAQLLLGLQAFCRHVHARDGSLAVADVEGALWSIPARNVRSMRLRFVPPSHDVRATSGAVDPRTAFGPDALGGSGRC